MTASDRVGAPGSDPLRARRQLVAELLHVALAEQSRICVIGGAAFPLEQELLGRDLSLLTLVESDAERAAVLRVRFSNNIVVETIEIEAAFDRYAALDERFNLMIMPHLAVRLDDDSLSSLLRKSVSCLHPGGRLAIVISRPDGKLGEGVRTSAEVAELLAHGSGSAGLMVRIMGSAFGALELIEARLAQ